VSQADAIAYGEWARLRLPTEAEWERAAVWDPRDGEAHLYPWGDDPATIERANLRDLSLVGRDEHLAPVKSFPKSVSPVGAINMAGNAREWVLDRRSESGFFEALAAGKVGRLNPCDLSEGEGVLKGGTFRDQQPALIGAAWDHHFGSDEETGFRIAIRADGSPRPVK
jgi:iron(II)-dependent oxidoreductase